MRCAACSECSKPVPESLIKLEKIFQNIKKYQKLSKKVKRNGVFATIFCRFSEFFSKKSVTVPILRQTPLDLFCHFCII
jgi:hypothetical protein